MDHDPKEPSLTQIMRWQKAERIFGVVISIKDFEKLLGSYSLSIGMPGKKLWDQFLNKLWGINSLHALEDFFEKLPLKLERTKEELKNEVPGLDDLEEGFKLSKNSPFGAFFRRARLEYQRLQFHDCTELWKNFVRYRQPTAHYQKKKHPDFGRYSFDNVLLLGELEDWNMEKASTLASVAYGDMLAGDRTGTLPVSTDDIESLLDFQVEQMQKYGNRIPVEIRHQFHDLLHDSFLVPSLTHYLTFLDAWRAGNYPAAFDYLHRYFDYTMQYRDRLFYQYALMNLAVLQADFGCHKEAVAAMLETVTTARENRDMTCLNFALNWLFHFGRAHPDLVRGLQSDSLLGSGKESLAFLRVKARETGMLTLWSSVLLSEAKLCLVNGDSVATTLEYVTRSSQINAERNMKGMYGSQLSLCSSLWGRLGQTHMSAMSCEIFLRCFAPYSVFDDEIKVTTRLSQSLLDQGKYDEALRILEKLNDNSLRSWKPSQFLLKHRGIIQLQRDLSHNNLDGAEILLDQLLQSKSEDLEPDIDFMIDSLHVECLTRRANLQKAAEKIDGLVRVAKVENRDIALFTKLLLIKVSLLEMCGRPQRALSIAIRAANMSMRARLIPCLWQAVGALSNILISLGEFQGALDLLNAVLPRSLEGNSPRLTGQLYSYLADANMGLAGLPEVRHEASVGRGTKEKESRRNLNTRDKDSQTKKHRDECLTRAAAAVQRSFDHFSNMEDVVNQCRMMAKKAVIMKLLGDVVLAADYASAYAELAKRAEAFSIGRGNSKQNS